MPHQNTHKNAAVAAILLLWRIVYIPELQRSVQQLTDLICKKRGLVNIEWRPGIIVKSHVVNYGDKEKRPMEAAFKTEDVAWRLDWDEDVCCLSKIGKGLFDGQRVGDLHEHEDD